MPWCHTCDRFLSPSTVRTDGTCPECGRPVDPGHAHPPDASRAEAPPTGTTRGDTGGDGAPDASVPITNVYGEPIDDEKAPLPWHLKLLAGALAVYLGYRFLQGVEWILGK